MNAAIPPARQRRLQLKGDDAENLWGRVADTLGPHFRPREASDAGGGSRRVPQFLSHAPMRTVTIITRQRDSDGHTRFRSSWLQNYPRLSERARNSTGTRRRVLDSRRLRGIRCGVLIGPSQNKPSRPNIDSHTSSRQSSDDKQTISCVPGHCFVIAKRRISTRNDLHAALQRQTWLQASTSCSR